MHRQQVSSIAHSGHPIAAPLSDDSVHALLDRALPRGDARLLDLGCGSGTWLVRAQTARPGLRAEGVDNDTETIAAARRAVADAGLGDQIAFHVEDAAQFASQHLYDVVLSIGSAHAFGGLLPTLEAAARHLSPGGSVLLGECFWEREPDRATLDSGFTPDEYDDLATTVDRVMADGWIPVHGHVSTLQEWDDYEWSWTGALSRWALDHPEHSDNGQALEAAAAHRTAWLHGYRGTLGFVTLLLRRTTRP
ncbi:class I SAM-dependent methyltransferase [Streptomyces sp. NPDC020766]|uniref:SAM-dependent methyltransferase n=1 Tax=Streptomyces sp. NPDC020766 TaxID=3155011 RepID=UPI0033E7F92B